MSKLRFAALIRVSTEKQEKTGESLRTQRAENEAAVRRLGGTVVEWYGGQEHATPGHERKELDRLLADARRGKFDAVIVTHPDRWSRDNSKSKEGLTVLRTNKVRFYAGSTEYDLFNPNARLFLGMSAEIGEYQAGLQNEKSINNRIARAHRGVPAVGNLPFGRTFDRKTERWGIDPAKQKMMEAVARRYLAGEALPDLADEYGTSDSTLRLNLMERCGPVWVQEFRSDALNIHEVVPTPVPELLSPALIADVKARAVANTLHLHGGIKHSYLLSRMVFCGFCGYAMFGVTNTKRGVGVRYYRHPGPKRKRKRPCRLPQLWVHADDLEDAVLRHLYETFGNPLAMQEAVVRATPDAEKQDEARARLVTVARELEKVKEARARLVNVVAKGTLKEADVEEKAAKLAAREAKFEDESARLLATLKQTHDPEAVKARAKNLADFGLRLASRYEAMTAEEKRGLAQLVFGGKTPDGRRMGVYVNPVRKGVHGRRGQWDYTIRGHLIDTDGCFPQPDTGDEPFLLPGDPQLLRGFSDETNPGCGRPAAGPPTPPTSSGTPPCCRGEVPSARPPGAAVGRAQTPSRTSRGRP